MKTEQRKLEKSQVEITFELTAEEFKKHAEHALLRLKKSMKFDGFRPGQAPLKMVEERVGKENLLMEAGDLAVKDAYSRYISENKLEPVGRPEIQIMKIAQGSPFIFRVKIAALPEIELPDYKEIAGRIKSREVSVTEEEIRDALNYLQRSRAKFTAKNPLADSERGDFVEIEYQSRDIDSGKTVKDRFILGEGGFVKGFEDNIERMKAGEEKEFSVKFSDNYQRKDLAGKDIVFKIKMVSLQKMNLPEMNDEFAKGIGAFDGITALKNSLKEGIMLEKTEAEKQRKRGEILDRISERINFEIPEIMVDYEKNRLLEDLKQKISQTAKISFEDYLASVKQTEESIKETFSKEAEKRIKNFLALREIGKKEGIEISELEVEKEIEKSVKNHWKDQIDKIDMEQFKEYTKGAMSNEKVFQFLENISQN